MNESLEPNPALEWMLTTAELAAFLHVPAQAIADMRHAGHGPRPIRLGGEIRYRMSDIERWLTLPGHRTERARRTAYRNDPRQQADRPLGL